MMKAAFEEVLRCQQLTPLFQPIVDIQNKCVIGYEALIRGPQNSHLYTPYVLFKIARELKRERELEQLCCRLQLAEFSRLGLEGWLFLNLSPQLFIDLSRLDDSDKPWCFPALAPSQPQVVIELSEQELSQDYEQLRIAAERCRRQNVRFAIDDLGEGYASLRLWSELQPEYVKLDRYFTQHLHRHPFKQALLQAISQVALKNGTSVIAEGVEQKVQLEVLQKLGVSHAQGYYFGHPLANPERNVDHCW